MSIYTKRGDKGITDMARTRNISKSDDRIQLGGAVDELSSHIGLMLSIFGFVNSYDHQETVQFLETIQKNLDLIAAGVEDPYNRECRISEEQVTALETETDHLEELCKQPVSHKLTGRSSLAAEIDITRAVARRAERCLAQVSVKFGADTESKKSVRLSVPSGKIHRRKRRTAYRYTEACSRWKFREGAGNGNSAGTVRNSSTSRNRAECRERSGDSGGFKTYGSADQNYIGNCEKAH